MGEALPTIKPPPSYATRRYYPLHAFKWVAADGSERWVRYMWVPEAEEPEISRSEAKKRGPDYLQEEIVTRLGRGPVRFSLTVQIAGDGDDPHDATSKWPQDRERVTVGTLEITALSPEGPPGGEPFVFDPMRLTDGIEPSDDPILLYRPAAYSESVERRAEEAQRVGRRRTSEVPRPRRHNHRYRAQPAANAGSAPGPGSLALRSVLIGASPWPRRPLGRALRCSQSGSDPRSKAAANLR